MCDGNKRVLTFIAKLKLECTIRLGRFSCAFEYDVYTWMKPLPIKPVGVDWWHGGKKTRYLNHYIKMNETHSCIVYTY